MNKKFRAWHKEAKEMMHGTPAQIFKWREDGQPIVILQYIGYQDKNGVEIYEGDIIDPVSCIGNCSEYLYSQTGFIASKVIGNIYENPEMLGGEK